MNDETRRERIVLETERHRIVGDVTLPAEGYRSRLSDMLNRESLNFVPLANATITDINGPEEVTERRFIAVARDHIQIAYEEADDSEFDEELTGELLNGDGHARDAEVDDELEPADDDDVDEDTADAKGGGADRLV